MPATIDEAVSMLAESSDGAVPIAGGTDLLVEWPCHLDAHGRTYLDLSGLTQLRAHHWTPGGLVLGALTSFWDIVCDPIAQRELPMLVAAARTVGAIQIQSRGTFAGNIANASPAADGVLALMALDTTVELTGPSGTRSARLDEFYTGYKQSVRAPDELITRIVVPRCERAVQSFVKVGSRRAQAITKAGLALVRTDAGWRVAAGSMGPTVTRCPAIERLIDDRAPIASADDLLGAIDTDVSPIDDIRSTVRYRRQAFARVLFAELTQACPWIGDAR